jgi:hypothetical protein
MGLNSISWIRKKELAKDGYCFEKFEYQILINDNCDSNEIMTKICLLVKYQKEKDTPDYESGKYTWTYTGGCYNDGHLVLYE